VGEWRVNFIEPAWGHQRMREERRRNLLVRDEREHMFRIGVAGDEGELNLLVRVN
jgi:hypothetical protein